MAQTTNDTVTANGDKKMEKIWLKHYPSDIPETINPDSHDSVVALFDKSCKEFANNPAFSNLGVELTYAQLDEHATAMAAYFQQELKLEKGDRIALMMPNLLQFPVAMFGALKAGLVVVNVNPLYTATELAHQLNDADAKALIVMCKFACTVEKALPDINLEHVIVTDIGDMLGTLKGMMVNFVVKHIHHGVPAYNIPNEISFKTALAKGHELAFKPVAIQGDDLAFLQYTGGTTGVAKGAMLSHRNMVANVIQSLTWVRGDLRASEEVIVAALPLYHIFSLTVCCMCFMTLGSKCLLITDPRDMKRFMNILRKEKFTVFAGVNTLFNGLLNQADFDKLNFSNLKLTIGGGMAVQQVVSDRWQNVTGQAIIEGYGLTETSPVVSINPIKQTHFNGSVGLPVPSTDVQVRDENGKVLPIGGEGELWVKGPQVMQGYWQKPEETANVIDADGWLSTGDIVRLDERGYIYIIDRKKDMILVSGFNVYPNEIEAVIAQHSGVLEVAVIGVPCEKTGEAVKAFIVKKDPDITEGMIIAHCRESLTSYKVPRRIEFRDELPKTNVGKVLRRSLRD